MKYENYKIEDCYFLNHGEEWDEDEANEVLSTFPETKNDERKIVALEQLLVDIDNGAIKMTTWRNFHPSSAKAYANSHNTVFGYRNETYSKSAGMYIIINGEETVIKDKWDVQNRLDNLRNNRSKIKTLARKYSRQEQTAKKNRETEEYETIHADRIDQGLRTKEKMYGLDLNVCVGLDRETWRNYYQPNMKRLNGSNYISYNRYGELTTRDDKLLSVETGQELEKVCDELAKEISEIIDIYNGKFKDVLRKAKVEE